MSASFDMVSPVIKAAFLIMMKWWKCSLQVGAWLPALLQSDHINITDFSDVMNNDKEHRVLKVSFQIQPSKAVLEDGQDTVVNFFLKSRYSTNSRAVRLPAEGTTGPQQAADTHSCSPG